MEQKNAKATNKPPDIEQEIVEKKYHVNKSVLKKYWRRNLLYLVILLTIWFLVSYGCGILFVDELNTIKLGGFKLGFWFAQQGSIYIFVALIFVYVWLMSKLDKKYHLNE